MQAININPRCLSSCSSSSGVYGSLPITHFRRPYAVSISIAKYSKPPCFSQNLRRIKPCFARSNFTISRSSRSETSFPSDSTEEDDIVSKILKENPSQVEPRFRIGDKLYTLEERERLRSKNFLVAANEFMRQLKKKREKTERESREDVSHESKDEKLSEGGGESVYLKDILREHRGQLYVPEQLFRSSVSQEEEFDRVYENLPIIKFDEFAKFMDMDKVQFLTVKESGGEGGVRHFIVDLKEIPGEKSLHRTKWAMKLSGPESKEVLERYAGPLNEIETRTTTLVGKGPEYVNPVAFSISSRVMVELGMVAAIMVSATAIIGGFLASAVFAATSFAFVTFVYVVWPVVRPFLVVFLRITFGVIGRLWCSAADFAGDLFFFVTQAYTLGGLSSSIVLLLPSVLVLGSFGVAVRYMLARSPKDFKKWDIWQGLRFSQSKAEARVDGSTGVTFADVAGIDEAVDELLELVRYLKNPELFEQMGIKPPHGVLLEGPPGCGKTLVAKAIAGEAGVPFYQMAGSEFVQILVGVGSARIRDLFKRAKVNRPSVVFVDEIDALGTRREGMYNEEVTSGYNANTQERETTLNQLLIELDGFDTGKGVIFIGATNRKDLLDPALLRPGRFDRKIKVMPPNERGRFEVLKVHARNVHLNPSVDLSIYANNLPGWSGAKLAQLLQEAALVAARKGHESIMESDMDEAVDRLTIGPVRLGLKLSQPGLLRRATTELGTAITSQLLRRFENAKIEECDRVSIRPRGDSLSQLIYHRMDEESVVFQRRPTLLHRLQVFLGGRAAEEIVFGRDTSTASVSYLADATWLARKMITVWNLEDQMTIHGEPPAWRKMPEYIGPRLDFEGSLYRHYGLIEEPINFELDDEVCRRTENLLKETFTKTIELLKTHEAAVLKGIKVLLHKQEISGEEIDYIIEKYPANTPVSVLLEESNPGIVPFFGEDSSSEEGREMEHIAATASGSEMQ